MDELLQRVLAKLGKTQEDFDNDVESLKAQSNSEMMANLIAMLMQNADLTGQMVGDLIQENADLKARIEALEGGQPA
jgi:hypothetical protein